MVFKSTVQWSQIKFCKVQKIASEIYVMQCIVKGFKSVTVASGKFAVTLHISMCIYIHLIQYFAS
jgi:hypothetical protein